MSPLERFLARLGIAPFDPDNELHQLLFDALKDAATETHMERLIITRGVLARAHADSGTAMGKAQAKHDEVFRDTKLSELEAGSTVSLATAKAEKAAAAHHTDMLDAQALWRSVKEFLRTVDKDIDKTRSEGVDARQQRAAETYGGTP